MEDGYDKAKLGKQPKTSKEDCKINAMNDDDDDYSATEPDDNAAAENLIFMSRATLDAEDAFNLQKMRDVYGRTCKIRKANSHGVLKQKQEEQEQNQVKQEEQVQNQVKQEEQVQNQVKQEEQINQVAVGNIGKATELPAFGYSFSGLQLPEIPPVKCLEGLMGIYSMPFQKQLTHTDVSKSHNRISFSNDDVKQAFLPVLHSMNVKEQALVKGLEVTVYDSEGKKYNMKFKTWPSSKVYVLNTVGWNKFVKDHSLVEFRDWINVWMFQHVQTKNLCFVLIADRFETPKLIRSKGTSRFLETSDR